MNFGESLNDIISKKGISKKELSEKTNISQSQITNYSKNKVVPKCDTVAKLEKALGVKSGSLQALINEDNYSSMNTELKKRKNIPEEAILKAWKRGDRDPYEVSKITGYSMKTISRYLPI